MMAVTDKKLVLIVDDTPTNIAVVSGLLKDSFQTKVATNGEKALAIATGSEKPDLILLDIMMPGMDGYEVCRRLKDNPATRDIPIIFLTAKTEELDEEKGFDVGAVDYIHKPFSGPIVLARVRTQLALQEALTEARAARMQADQLLHALLPQKAADEIRSIGTVIPRRYENVAVLFCDVTNFTAYCDNHEPEDVVSRLDALFVIFERIAAKHGLEKIKTIGDAYMAAAGVPSPRPDHAEAVARMAIDIRDHVEGHFDPDGNPLAIRIGIDSGPVVAGVIGKTKFIYDLWGDTVNTASRMESHGVPGRIQVTERTKKRLGSRFRFERRGPIQIKGKGEMVTYFLLDGARGRLSPGGGQAREGTGR
jgi:class 3 adenylate cyclase